MELQCFFIPFFPRIPVIAFTLPLTLFLMRNFGTSSAEREMESARQSPVALSYYNLVIQEYSYKFWASFMVATLIILVYSCLAAVWLSKTVYAPPPIEYDEYDYLGKRSIADKEFEELYPDDQHSWPAPPSPRTTRRILAAVSSPPVLT